MGAMETWTFFFALSAFIFSVSCYIILCKCWKVIETILRRLSDFRDDYNWDHFHGERRGNEK